MDQQAEVMAMDIQRFILLASYAQLVVESDADWKTKFDVIFEDVKPKIDAAGIRLQWDDPDMDYEDDVRAFVKAVTEKAEELKKLPTCKESVK